jgi:GNAT superfamily N-acetyltransferase
MSSNGMNIRGPITGMAKDAETILRSLPDWFGIEQALLDYARNTEALPTFVAEQGGSVVGFLSLREHFAASWEIDCVAVHADTRAHGIGRALLQHAERWLLQRGAMFLQVKTLAASHPSQAYAETRRFYEAAGFVPVEVLPTLWGERLPVLLSVKCIRRD